MFILISSYSIKEEKYWLLLSFFKRRDTVKLNKLASLGLFFVCQARHLLYFRGYKSSFIWNQLPGFIVLMNKAIFLCKSSMLLFVLCGYLLILWYIHVTKPQFHWLVCDYCLISFTLIINYTKDRQLYHLNRKIPRSHAFLTLLR